MADGTFDVVGRRHGVDDLAWACARPRPRHGWMEKRQGGEISNATVFLDYDLVYVRIIIQPYTKHAH